MKKQKHYTDEYEVFRKIRKPMAPSEKTIKPKRLKEENRRFNWRQDLDLNELLDEDLI